MTNSRQFDRPLWYQIRIHGRLDQTWASWFDDFELTPQTDGDTVLVGLVADQAALHGLLAKIRNLGLPLLAISYDENRCSPRADNVA